MLKISKHWLDTSDEISHMACAKNKELFDRGHPDSIIIHYTAGRSGESSAKYLVREDIKASAHIVLDRSGHIYQLVPFNTKSWHAGRSSYEGRSGFNNFSIGIEIDNAGPLEPTGDKFKAWFGKTYEKDEVVKARHRNESTERYWHTYTERQIDLTQQLCESLMEVYPTISSVLGHEEIAPGRKSDPGPAFPLDKLRSLLIDNRDENLPSDNKQFGYVDVDQLNIRDLPSINAELASAPLEEGTRVKVQAEMNGWYKVTAEIEGWVAGKYISFDE